MGKLAEHYVEIGAKIDEFQNKMSKVAETMKKHEMRFKKIGKAMTIVGAAISATLIMMVKKASDAQETSAKFGTVFEDAIEKANASVKDLVKNYGLSTLAAETMLSATGDLLTGLGIQGEVALSLSEKTQKLAVDLASFTNFAGGAKGASDALTKAMLGERESVKALGIVITEEMVKEELLKQGKEDLTGQAKLQAKAEATLIIAYRQSKNAIGDYERTKGSLANMTRTLLARLEDLWVKIGTHLIPIFTEIIGKVKDTVSNVVAWIEKNPKLTGTIVKVALVLGGLMAVLGPLAMALPGIVMGFTAMIGPAGLVVVAIAGVALVAKRLADNLRGAKKEMSDFADEALVMAEGAENFRKLFVAAEKEGGGALEELQKLLKRFGGNWEKVLKQIIKDPKLANLKVLLMNVAEGIEVINLEGKKLGITLPEGFGKVEKALEKTVKKGPLIFEIFHQMSIRIQKLKEAARGFEAIIPPAAFAKSEMTLEKFKAYYERWLEDLKIKWKNAWEEMLYWASYFTYQVGSIFSQMSQNRMQQIDNEYEKGKKAIENSIEDEEEKAVALERLEGETESRRRAADRKAAASAKMMAAFEAIIYTARAIAEALPNLALAITVGAIGALQVGTILAAPLPSFEGGGDVPRDMVAQLHAGEYVSRKEDVRAGQRILIPITIDLGSEKFKTLIVRTIEKQGNLGMLKIPAKVVI